ncbi:MAG: GNAT family N-acetyltransferase [Bacteroidia bacterium]
MKIVEVNDHHGEKAFLKVPFVIYRTDANWVCPLHHDIESVFDRMENLFFHEGDAKRWLLFDDMERLIGRVAAFYNEKYFKQSGKKIGGMGFFECTQDEKAARLLFDTCRNWLKEKGIEGMDGPINFGEKDRFWGLMVSGFKNPSYQENYNPPYYQTLFENYGFVKTVEQSTSEITKANFNHDRFYRIAQRVLNNPAYQFEHYREKEMEKFAADFLAIYNQAWANRTDFMPMTIDRVYSVLKSLKPILLEDLIWFAYANGEPAGFYINIIDVNQIFKHMKGKMDLFAKLKFLWYKKFGRIDRTRGIVFGVIPKYQNLGLETGMIMKFHDAMMSYPNMRASELAWIGDFNPKMHSLFEALGAKTTKVHYTYRIEFN